MDSVSCGSGKRSLVKSQIDPFLKLLPRLILGVFLFYLTANILEYMDIATKEETVKKIRCKNCGSYNFQEIKSGVHLKASCNDCGCFIKFIPQGNEIDKMPFGKYKDQLISEIKDLQYFVWLMANSKLKGSLLVAIQERIKELS